MRNIDIEKIVEEAINEMFRGSSVKLLTEAKKKNGSSKSDTKYVTRAKKDLVNSFQKYYDTHKEKTAERAKNVGIALDKGAERTAYGKDVLAKNNNSYEEALRNMSPEVRDAINAMLKVEDPNTPASERMALNQKYGGFSGFQRYRDILDKLSLTSAYDQERAGEAGTDRAMFGTKYKVGDELSDKKPKNLKDITGFDYENLDLTDVPEVEIIKYFKTGTRKDHHLDEDEKNPTYSQLAEMAKNGNDDALTILKNLFFKAEFNKVLNSKFGYDFQMPGAMYTYGNSKLPNDTLVINFTTAHRCQAWKECLVGYACYARGSEHNYEGLHRKNSNLHLMWLSTNDDPELMLSMQRVIKMYLVNPEEMAAALLTNPTTKNKWFAFLSNEKQTFNPINAQTNKSMEMPEDPILGMKEGKSMLGMVLENIEEAARKNSLKQPKGARANLASYIYENDWSKIFSKYDIAAIKANPKSFRAKFIRLNEEGDFIGQWLLDAFNEFAGELKLLGISTAAYTCRNLDFTKIQNIILNASTLNVGTKGEENGNVSNAIARRFFAVSEELYDKLEDTYLPGKNKFNYVPTIEYDEKGNEKKSKTWDGKTPIVPLHRQGNKWAVKYALKPYTLDGNTAPVEFNDRFDPNGATQKRRLYYKCPCGRYGDVIGEDGKPIKMDCYLCRMCYEPKNMNTGEIYVLVKVHGDNIDSFNMDRANSERGINDTMSTYAEARNIFGNRLSEATQMSEKEGLRLVSENVVNSAKEHISSVADSQVNSMRNENRNFNNFMNRLNEIENKQKKERFD